MIYEPLNKQENEIRLVTLHPASYSSKRIVCSLDHYKIDDAPPHGALSYCWGDENDTVEIRVDGQSFPATRNLFNCLKQFQAQTTCSRMWIDAICIDQKNADEKNYQVPMMGEIYRKATQTVAWLGEEQGDVDLAFELLNQLAQAERHLFERSQTMALDQDVEPVFHLIAKFMDNKYWIALENLTSLPYWKRLWVVQEAVLGNSTELRCGRHRLLLSDYRLAMHLMATLRSPCNAKFLTDIQRVHPKRDDHFVLLYTMKAVNNWIFFDYPSLLHTLSSKLECRDPRDKIFALIGLAQLAPIERRVRILPDYGQPASIVYRSFATSWFHSTQDFTLIAYAGTGKVEDDADQLVIPSWVPRPEAMRMINFLYNLHAYNAGSHTSYLDFSVIGNDLHLHAVLCDTINDFKIPVLDGDFGLVAQSLVSLFGLLDFNDWLRRAHPTGLPWLQIFFRTIISDCSDSDGSGWPNFSSTREEDEFFEQAAGFCGVLEKTFDLENVALAVSEEAEDFALTLGRWAKKFGLYPLKSGVQTRDSLLEPFCGPEGSASHLRWPRLQKDMGRRMMSESYIKMHTAFTNVGFFVTERGYVGLGAKSAARSGDKVCIVPGCKVSLVVRKVTSAYQVRGDCYVFGMMMGEVMQTKIEA